jgi:hypothetical protein
MTDNDGGHMPTTVGEATMTDLPTRLRYRWTRFRVRHPWTDRLVWAPWRPKRCIVCGTICWPLSTETFESEWGWCCSFECWDRAAWSTSWSARRWASRGGRR